MDAFWSLHAAGEISDADYARINALTPEAMNGFRHSLACRRIDEVNSDSIFKELLAKAEARNA